MPPLDNAGLDSGDTVNATLAKLRTSTAQPGQSLPSDAGYNVFQDGNKIGWLTDPSKAPPGSTVIPVAGGEPVSGGKTQVASAAIPAPAAGDPGVRIQQESAGQQFDKTGAPLIPAQFKGKPEEWNAPVGVTQVRPSTAYGFFPNVDLLKLQTDPAYNKAVGNAVHSKLYQQYGNNATMADIAYDWGTGHLDYLLKTVGDPRKGQISWAEFTSHLPAETQAYITANGTHSPVSHQSDSQPVGAPEHVVSGTGYSEMFPVKNIFDEMRATQYGAKTEADATLKDIRRSLSELSKPPPTVQPTPPTEVWGSLAMAVAALGGLLTHTPATTALNAMGGVMKAFSEGDQQRAEMAMKQWKVANDALLRTAKMKVDLYSDAMSRYKEAPEQAKAELMANAAALNDQAMVQLLEKGDWQGAMAMGSGGINAYVRLKNESTRTEQALKDRAEAQRLVGDLQQARASGDPQKVASAEQALRDFNAIRAPAAASVAIETPKPAAAAEADVNAITNDRISVAEQKKGAPLTDSERATIREQVRQEAKSPAISDEAADFVAGRVLAGDERATVGMARSSANMAKVVNSMVRLAKEQNITPAELAIHIAEFQGAIAGERTLGTRTANMEVAANEAKAMAPIALEASEKVSRTEYPTLNSVLIAAARGTGDENVVRFAQATNALIYSYSKFLNPTGIPTDSDKARATDILSTAWTQGQFKAAIDLIIKKEIPTGKAAIQDTRQEFRQGLGTRTGNSQEGSTDHPDNLPDGTTVIQHGVKYRKSNGQWVEAQ